MPPAFYSDVSQFVRLRPALAVPRQPIRTAGGSLIDFATLRGQVVVLNFWATWCPPCVAEMPSLDRLAAAAGRMNLPVIPVAMDMSGASAVTAFYARLKLHRLGIYLDPGQQLGHFNDRNPWTHLFPLWALPTTYLIDPQSMVVGYVPGAARWDSPAAFKLLAWVARH